MIRRLALITLLASLCVAPLSAGELEDRAAKSREAVGQFMGKLKAELQAAMKAGGPANAIQVCNTKAPAIAREMGDETGWLVGRTSLKVRNANNAPDAWERAVLERFEQWKAEGRSPESLEFFEAVDGEEERAFRYMKAIPTGQVCITCHGKNLPADVEAKLNALYPNDQARGFDIGDLRGAFTITQPM